MLTSIFILGNLLTLRDIEVALQEILPHFRAENF